MPQRLALVSLLVRDYDEALGYYIDTLGFDGSRTRRCPNRTSAGS